MKKSVLWTTIGFLVLFMMSVLTVYPVWAQESVEELKKQIEILQKRVDQLETEKQMPDRGDPWGFFHSRQNRPWDPFAEINRMQQEMNQMFQNSFDYRGNLGTGMFSSDMSFGYDVDIKETDEGYEIIFDMAGLDQEKVDIQVNESSITVKGEHRSEEKEESENSMFRSQSYGSFLKTIPVPEDADTTKVKTEREGKRLVIKFPKKA